MLLPVAPLKVAVQAVAWLPEVTGVPTLFDGNDVWTILLAELAPPPIAILPVPQLVVTVDELELLLITVAPVTPDAPVAPVAPVAP